MNEKDRRRIEEVVSGLPEDEQGILAEVIEHYAVSLVAADLLFRKVSPAVVRILLAAWAVGADDELGIERIVDGYLRARAGGARGDSRTSDRDSAGGEAPVRHGGPEGLLAPSSDLVKQLTDLWAHLEPLRRQWLEILAAAPVCPAMARAKN